MSMLGRLLGPRIKCSACEKTFRANLSDVDQLGGVLRSFTCPHCSTVYPVVFIHTDGKIEDRRGAN